MLTIPVFKILPVIAKSSRRLKTMSLSRCLKNASGGDMKILMITPYLPYPLVSGGQIRTYNLLKNLAPKHQITLASFIRDSDETQYLKDLKPFCKKIIILQRRRAFSPLNI